ncbi:unnamed protein product, partial [Rotaria magnacalcarata]
MIKTALPTGSFDQFLSSYEDDR